jgi:hypothetical protein
VLDLAEELRGLLGRDWRQEAHGARACPVVGLDQLVAEGLQGERVPGAQQLAALVGARGPQAGAGGGQVAAQLLGVNQVLVSDRPGAAVCLHSRRGDLAMHRGGQPRHQRWVRVLGCAHNHCVYHIRRHGCRRDYGRAAPAWARS